MSATGVAIRLFAMHYERSENCISPVHRQYTGHQAKTRKFSQLPGGLVAGRRRRRRRRVVQREMSTST